jgi:predicted LPLAT superfamily acyltransferase
MPRPADRPVGHDERPDWVERPERSSTLALRFMAWVAMALGRPVARLFLFPVCLYFLAFSPRARSASRQYLSRVLGRGAHLADLFRHYHCFASVLLDRVFLLNDQFSRFDVRIHGAEIIDELIARREGCVLLGAHLGSFEIARSAGRTRGLKLSMLMYEENARKVGAVLKAINPHLQTEIIALGEVDSMLKVEAALSRGGLVGMLSDRTPKAGGTVDCPFLGEPARFPTGDPAATAGGADLRPLPGRQPVRDSYRAVRGAGAVRRSRARPGGQSIAAALCRAARTLLPPCSLQLVQFL